MSLIINDNNVREHGTTTEPKTNRKYTKVDDSTDWNKMNNFSRASCISALASFVLVLITLPIIIHVVEFV